METDDSAEMRMATLLMAAIAERNYWRRLAERVGRDWEWDEVRVRGGSWPGVFDRYASLQELEKSLVEKPVIGFGEKNDDI